jgi:8-oxo-dGTP diphosphatase
VAEETGLTLLSVSVGFAVTNDIFTEVNKHYITVWVEATVGEIDEAENLEPEKCDGWEWYHGPEVPTPRFLGLQNLIDQRPAYWSYT